MTKTKNYHSQLEELIFQQGDLNYKLKKDDLNDAKKEKLGLKKVKLEEETRQFCHYLNTMIDEQEEEIKYFLKTLQIRRTISRNPEEKSEVERLKEQIKMDLEVGFSGMIKMEYHFNDIEVDIFKFTKELDRLKEKYGVYDSTPQIEENYLEELSDRLLDGVNTFNVENAWSSILDSSNGFKANLLDALNGQGQVEKRHYDVVDRINNSYLERIKVSKKENSDLKERLRISDRRINNLKQDIQEYEFRFREIALYDEPNPSKFKKILPYALTAIIGGAIAISGYQISNKINENDIQTQEYNQQIEIGLENN